MYIKQIIIQGFKSYKDQTVIEPFSPKTNVVVGRNGSGKSNFFAAIRFVLSDAYTQMGREERQGLLHEGSGSAVMQAYVEIIFDNSDDRFPTGGKEVTLRRSIGLKKDEYSVDKKVVTKSDVMNLLEAAGFSRSNPYYIVPQGRVTALTNMKESDRLNLLKEVAGTQVYEARRAESLKIMNETNNKREKIDELLEYIKERLAELEEEKEELRGFQDTDRERRCLEYAYHHQEQVSVQEHLNQIDNSRQGGLENADSSRAAFLEGEKQIDKLEAQIHKLERDMHLLQIERSQLEEDRRDSAKSLAQAELKTRSLQDGQSAQEQAQIQHEAELQGVRADIANKEAELQQILPNYNRQKESEDGIAKQLLEAQSARDLLLSKQGRGSRFTNKTERDNWLKQEIKELRSNLNVQNGNMIDVEADIKGIEQSIANGESTLAEHRSTLGNWNINRAQIVDEVNAAINKGQRLNDERKLLRREQDKLNTIISDARQEKDVADREMASAIDGATARGLASIRRLKEDPRQNIPGAYGTLAELLEVNEAYRLPVEQIAGASLFHYVVDNADTATYLADTLHKQRGGRVTFMPLAQLRPRHINLPRSNDAVPLLSKLTYDPMFEKAFQQVFGKVVVCPNLAVAGQYARSHGVDGITVEGDTTNKRGAMTGGYIDPKKSRLVAIQGANRCRQELDRLNAQSVNLRDQIDTKDQDVTSAATDLNKVESKLRQTDASLDPLKAEMRNLRGHIDFQRSQLDDAMKRRDTTQRNINTFLQEVSAHEAELGTEFKHSLSAAEEQRLEQQSFVAQDLQRQWNEKSRARRELQQQKQFLETELRQNLPMRLDQLNSQALEFPSSGGKSGSLAEAQRELKKAQAAVKAAETTLHETETEIDNLASQIEAKSTEKFNLEQTQQGLSAEIEKQQKRMDKTLQQKALLTSQAAECAKNIRDLGALPEEAFDKYENMETTTIAKRLKKVNEALKKYKHVNKKAFEQYNNFTMQQDQLMKRRQELDASQGSIEELVEHLDRRKDEAIERTFKQVSKEFSTIFSKLVPAGHGRLVIQRRTDPRQNDDESDEEARGSVENYVGVGISVSFNSKHADEQQRIQQLSGGQKSLCALCLIFALQQTESSPMVIFDEVDANLDAQYRTAVASLLESISAEAGTQFICTTFRPEIVYTADKCYGVSFSNKASTVSCVPMTEALRFVQGQAQSKTQ